MTIELPLKNISPDGDAGSDLWRSTSVSHDSEARSDSSRTENSRSKKEPSSSESEREDIVGESTVVEMVVVEVEGEDTVAEVVVVVVEPVLRQYLRRLKVSIVGKAREKRGALFLLFCLRSLSLAFLRGDEIWKGG